MTPRDMVVVYPDYHHRKHRLVAPRKLASHGISLMLIASSAATVSADCTVSGFAIPPGGVVRDPLCVNEWEDFQVGTDSCEVVAMAGYACSGTQASCTGGVLGIGGDFSAGDITCTALTCTRPSSTPGYTVTTELSLSAPSFSATGVCANHFWGTFEAHACTSAGAYTLSGCYPIHCVRPSSTSGYTILQETELNTANGFDVNVQCATGFSGAAFTNECSSDGGAYGLSGCGSCSVQTGCDDPGSGCRAGTNKLMCNPGGATSGYYVDGSGLVVACSAGTYAQAGHPSSSGCIPCAAGKYQQNTQQSQCIGCAAGTYVGSMRSTSSGDCISCAPGSVAGPNPPRSSGASTCMPCAVGLYSTQATEACIACVAGKYVESTGSSSESDCKLCGVGKYSELLGRSLQSDCIDCPAGKYLETEGADQASDCMACPDHKFSAVPGLGDQDQCIMCPCEKDTGETCHRGSADENCYCSEPNAYSTRCEVAQVLPGALEWKPTASNIEVGLCGFDVPMQVYCTDQVALGPGETTADRSCTCRRVDCEPGEKPNPQQGGSAQPCLACADLVFNASISGSVDGNKSISATGAACQECSAGKEPNCKVNPEEPCRECISCTTGKNSDGSRCVPCEAGKQPNGDFSACESCLGFGRDRYSPDGNPCLQCTAGKQPSTGLDACIFCSELDFNASDPGPAVNPAKAYSPGGQDCIECPVGQEPNMGRSECDGCEPGKHSDGSACVSCEPGKQTKVDQSGCDECRLLDDRYYSQAGEDCHQCEKGSQPNTNQTGCTPCFERGLAYYSDTGAECQECSVGQEPLPNRHRCKTCGTGNYSDGSECLRCSPGKQPNSPTNSRCDICPAGESSPDGYCGRCSSIGEVANQIQTACIPCLPGKQPNADRSGCDECRNQGGDAYSNAATLENNDVCQTCPAGSQPDENRTRCIRCSDVGIYHYSIDGAECQQCAAGNFPLGTQPNADRTQCFSCLAGEYSDGSRCMCAEGYFNRSLGTFRCFESQAADFVVDDSGGYNASLNDGSSRRSSPCTQCEGSCVVCGVGCSVDTPEECGRVSVRPGFAPYITSNSSGAQPFVGMIDGNLNVDNQQSLAEIFRKGERLHVGIFKCPRKTSGSENETDGTEFDGASTCCGEGRVRNDNNGSVTYLATTIRLSRVEECIASNILCAEGYNGVLCNSCEKDYTRKKGVCTLCPGKVYELQKEGSWRVFGILLTVLLVTGLGVAISLCFDHCKENAKDPLADLWETLSEAHKEELCNKHKISTLKKTVRDEFETPKQFQNAVDFALQKADVGDLLKTRVVQCLRRIERDHEREQALEERTKSELRRTESKLAKQQQGCKRSTSEFFRTKTIFAVFAALGLISFVLSVIMWWSEKPGVLKLAYFLFTWLMLLPLILTVGIDLYTGTYIIDKIKVTLGFVQTLVAAKDTFRLEFPVTFAWLVELIRSCTSL